ncbi:hypothetical protein BDA96_06G303600 [Sorghum bicolor]|uniref:Uncharacterized protein n=2 Tax=Sorghum bicolor TaxID=4558 RepID=A0A921UEN7_SORBI|nr:uncharacterized protein LOC8055472 [Sorghum bicolor]EES11704.1 hypothetical protein SORBI_3006G279000 [Sorghum bicolor]KAG0528265.1 hypothetical protein BDA96_06G303600 [Sorghum bicolor]|eukprot:XP_002447376.1 uncharacterized protein LOC8055472 [Sorghum bicolor]
MAAGGSSSSKPTNNNKVLRVWEMLDANDRARMAYKRLLARPTMLEVAKNVICLLLWMETTIGVKVLQQVLEEMMSRDDDDDPCNKQQKHYQLALLIKEADGLYSYLLDEPDDALPEPLVCNIPTIVSLCGGGGRLLDFRFFKVHKQVVARGVAVIRDTVAALVFNEHLHAMLRDFEDDLHSSLMSQPAPALELMERFVPMSTTPPEDSRMVFLAFSVSKKAGRRAHGISSQDIIHHFEGVFGFPRHIERVEIEQPCTGQDSKHGIILFKSPEKMKEAMFGETSAFFRIKSHDIWMQCYMPPF